MCALPRLLADAYKLNVYMAREERKQFYQGIHAFKAYYHTEGAFYSSLLDKSGADIVVPFNAF